ncbi:DUF4870 domain-containing protein [Xanthomonas oryzae]|uniref:DUF4870 domain-containing protein n=1 Tax=Xanthomonas oryzae TaxID=347 RepID=UPI000AEE0EFD|nr:DUF4870 domain-containing protein [Xanthomonas oryzae]
MNEPTPEGPSTHDEGTGHGTTDSAASIEERTLAAVAHRSLWIGLFVAGAVNMGFALGWLLLLWLLPGALWMATRDTLPFAAEHARQAMLLGGGLCALSMLLLAPTLVIFGAGIVFEAILKPALLVAMVLSLRAAIKAACGERYRYPLPYGGAAYRHCRAGDGDAWWRTACNHVTGWMPCLSALVAGWIVAIVRRTTTMHGQT